MTAAMNYQNYDSQIVQRLSVKLVGWTHHELVSPYEIHGVDDLRTLHATLVWGVLLDAALKGRSVTTQSRYGQTRSSRGGGEEEEEGTV